MIQFRCPKCSATFEIDDKFAGRPARCKSCGHRMKVPTAADGPRLDPNQGLRLSPLNAPSPEPRPTASAAPRQAAIGATARPTSWIDAVNSQVGLAPISIREMAALRQKAVAVAAAEEPSIAGPYQLASIPSLSAMRRMGGRPAGAVTQSYRRGLGSFQKIFRWLNDSAYLVSVPFLMCLIIGLAIDSRSLMMLGATAVVLLNLGRIVTGLFNLVLIPFRESPMQGLLFLIPPFTFFYLSKHWDRMRKPVTRVSTPLLTIGLVALAFAVEPWLRDPSKAKAAIGQKAVAVKGLISEKTGAAKTALQADDPSSN